MGKWYFVECPFSEYKTVLEIQLKIMETKRKSASFPDVVLFVEHEPV